MICLRTVRATLGTMSSRCADAWQPHSAIPRQRRAAARSQVAIRALGFQVKKAQIVELVREYDMESTGKIDKEQFLAISACPVREAPVGPPLTAYAAYGHVRSDQVLRWA